MAELLLSDPSHNYTTAGSYTVQLIVTNSNGCRDTITKPNAVTVGATTTGFSAPDSSCVGTAIPFNNTSTPVPASVLADIWRRHHQYRYQPGENIYHTGHIPCETGKQFRGLYGFYHQNDRDITTAGCKLLLQ